ncbi:GNAT family N-acetyltransferase [Flavobacterium foetidum]|uniref:GNAT family N-acetyltransferase n=1 Tax=Flavobacterium foetidum TaxID=2026681 RepID=UPI0010757827|nr:GNAT family N-acetyltransferase [Flavobacterium foetidum]KAF2517213.1 GNAT family N-acetyltransferase [Flavobacterium foetidum]
MKIKKINASDTWQIRHEVMWPEQPFEFVQLEEDNLGEHFGVFIEDKLVAIVSCFINGTEMQFRKLATLVSYQGQGIASELMNYILEFAKSNNIKKVWCNARTNKKSFYEKFGMQDTNQVFEKAGQEFTVMEIVLYVIDL